MESQIPGPDHGTPGEGGEPKDRSFEAFAAMIEAGIQAGKNKTKAQKERKKRDRVSQKHGWCSQLKRTQCYLGIRPRRSDIVQKDTITDPNLSWTEFMEAQKAYDMAHCVNLPVLDMKEPVPYQFSRSVVFICVDIEVWEKDHSMITVSPIFSDASRRRPVHVVSLLELDDELASIASEFHDEQ